FCFFTFLIGIIIILLVSNGCKKDDSNGNNSNNSNNNPTIQVSTLSTNDISNVTLTSAICGGNITSDGGAKVTVRGVCWSKNQTPTTSDSVAKDGTDTGTFTSNIIGLTNNTTYYVRAYATNSAGTGYGNIISFTTNVIDIDGNVYHTVKIGTQTWMVENLKTTKLNDGTAIPLVTNNSSWASLGSPGFCWYNNDETTNKNIYGALYNWYATATINLCPSGWHVPTVVEWLTLINFLGGELGAAQKLKESGNSHWSGGSANNVSGFYALPGGYRAASVSFAGYFYEINTNGYWWASDNNGLYADDFMMHDTESSVGHSNGLKSCGASVRCIKN
ncbi:MAG: fibrobacter succinogenes major paralogous domain-containing protein, partial [Bacteroidia bacterium]